MDTPFRGRNCWPDEELLPDFRTAMTQYYHEMNGVADRWVLQEARKLPDLTPLASRSGMHAIISVHMVAD